ncbi:MAG: DUF2628 domain-containing protein [Bacteroidales bacterium]|nr:DUF2628 domain-containing protein [Bacteroidales bacterium]
MEESFIKYIGNKCTSCEKAFIKEDDVVVCPDCGSPYHRDCYEKEGKCINTELHKKGGSWAIENKKNNEKLEENELKCPRCGELNPDNTLFCVKCGYPMQVSQEPRPFNDELTKQSNPNATTYNIPPAGIPTQNGIPPQFGVFTQQLNQQTVLDENTIGEYTKYTGSNPLYFLTQFLRFTKMKTKSSVNIMALLFPEFYFFYRKMNKTGIIVMALTILLSIPYVIYMVSEGVFVGITLPAIFANDIKLIGQIASVASILTGIMRVICSFFANYWYYEKAKKEIGECKNQGLSGDQLNQAIASKGGVSSTNVVVAITIYVAIIVGLLIGINYL